MLIAAIAAATKAVVAICVVFVPCAAVGAVVFLCLWCVRANAYATSGTSPEKGA